MLTKATPSEIRTLLNEAMYSLDRKLTRRDRETKANLTRMRRMLNQLETATWDMLREADERAERSYQKAKRLEEELARLRDQHEVEHARAVRIADRQGFDPNGHFVYVLWGEDAKRPLYVGQSTNVLARLGTHLVDPEKRPLVRTVRLVRCRDAAHMEATEADLIRAHRPPWNSRIPSRRTA